MEGRAIARPNEFTCQRIHGTSGRFNGGPSNCPAKRPCGRARETPVSSASMEGRAIARPNPARPMTSWRCWCRFNGGPSNCPAKRPAACSSARVGSTSFNGGPSNCPAKLRGAVPPTAVKCLGFNGGPSNCPAKRLGRVPGSPTAGRFNGGPSNCPAKHGRSQGLGVARRASMEGRAIARPNPPRRAMRRRHRCLLQWRAEQLPGQTPNCLAACRAIAALQWRAEQLPGQTAPVEP